MVLGVSNFFFHCISSKACNTFIKKLIPAGIYIMLMEVSDLVKLGRTQRGESGPRMRSLFLVRHRETSKFLTARSSAKF